MKKIFYFNFLLCFFLNNTVSARLADFQESEVIYKNLELKRKINADGTYELSYFARIEIKKDSARTDYGLYRFSYNPEGEEIVSLKARTINGKKSYSVPKNDIIIKPVASKGPGFDTKNQVSIAFSNVDVGSQIEISYRLVRKKASIPGLYLDLFAIGTRGLIEKHHEEWISKVPLNFELHDPENYYNINKTSHHISLNLKRPIFLRPIEETDSLVDPKGKVWFGVTNLNQWSDFPQKTIQYYEKTLTEKLPDLYQEMVSKAVNIQDPFEQINKITSQLADSVRYLGDWRQVKGAYHPRALSEIAKTKYGDCKDFSVSTAAMLRHLGYESYVAVIYRGRIYLKPPIRIPADDFNHAIVWATKNGKTFWIDPTNETSFAQGIYPDIEDREALIFKPSGAEYTRTPSLGVDNYLIQNNLEIQFINNNEILGKSNISLFGFGSGSIAGLALSKSKAQIDMILLKWATQMTDFIEWKLPDYDLKSRVIQDFSTNITFKANWRPIITSSGLAYQIKAKEPIRVLNIALRNRETSLALPGIYRSITNTQFVGDNLRFEKEIDCSGQSEWFDFNRQMKKTTNGIQVSEVLTVKKSIILNKELTSPTFSEEQKKILTCMGDYAIVFK